MDNSKILAVVGGASITEKDVMEMIAGMGPNGQQYANPQGQAMILEQLIVQKLFLADRPDYTAVGLWGVRLAFTTENARECVNITRRYLGDSEYEPGAFTRGLYYRGVE